LPNSKHIGAYLSLSNTHKNNSHIERDMAGDMQGVRVVEKYSPVIVMVMSNVAMGSVNALVKKALDVGVNHMVIGAYRMAISALILVPFAYVLERFDMLIEIGDSENSVF